MKNATKFITGTIFLMLLSMLFSCAGRGEPKIPYAEGGSYAGFSDITSDYTSADAERHGCLLIDIKTELNEYGVNINKEVRTAGYEKWQSFVAKAEAHENTFLRVATFIDGVGYYKDIYFVDGKYTAFDLNEYGVSEGKTFKYLRRLDGYDGPMTDRQKASYYVLTDSTELTFEDVRWSFFASDLSTVTKIPFEWLGFMIYFEK